MNSRDVQTKHIAETTNLRPSAVLQNDGPGYTIVRVSLVFSFFNAPTEFHSTVVSISTGNTFNFRAQTNGQCSGMFCVAEATVSNGTRRLLFGRTQYFDAGAWDTNVFTVSGDLREQPC